MEKAKLIIAIIIAILSASGYVVCYSLWKGVLKNIMNNGEYNDYNPKTMKWTRIDYKPFGHDYVCPECGWKNDMPTHYCPNCGADMREES